MALCRWDWNRLLMLANRRTEVDGLMMLLENGRKLVDVTPLLVRTQERQSGSPVA